MLFEFATANRILFGAGTVRQLGGAAASMGKIILLVTNLPETRIVYINASLTEQKLLIIPYTLHGEPTIELIAEGAQLARQNGCDLVIGVGGGSAIDAGKAIAALITNPGDLLDYLEVVGKGLPITNLPTPMIAVPTTAGTGAEVTRNAVIGVPEHHVKVSLRSPLLLPKLALIDPELTTGLPPEVTASTGLDALTQLIEPYVSVKANPLTDSICREGLQHIAHGIVRAYQDDDPGAREEMSLASLFGGLALANSGLGVVHGFASVLGGMVRIPHGVACARLLPFVMRTNLCALEQRNPHSLALHRYQEIAQILTGNSLASAADGISWIQELCTRMRIPPLADYGINTNEAPDIILKTGKASSTKANPIQLTDDELMRILKAAL
jgi:alcohol dehydrogenase class IV